MVINEVSPDKLHKNTYKTYNMDCEYSHISKLPI